MKARLYPLVTALALAASALLLACPPEATAAAAAAAPATPLITDPNHPRFAEQMAELYHQWGAPKR